MSISVGSEKTTLHSGTLILYGVAFEPHPATGIGVRAIHTTGRSTSSFWISPVPLATVSGVNDAAVTPAAEILFALTVPESTNTPAGVESPAVPDP